MHAKPGISHSVTHHRSLGTAHVHAIYKEKESKTNRRRRKKGTERGKRKNADHKRERKRDPERQRVYYREF